MSTVISDHATGIGGGFGRRTAAMPFDRIVPLDRLTPADAARAGAKAHNCARLKQAGFLVPDGLVVLSTATALEVMALAGHPWFDSLPADTRFAVRSSGIGEDGAGESFAGMHQTLLDVRREDVAAAVASCRASGQSATALEYRRTKGIGADAIEMGILIQKMVQPIAAGVAFTINPVTGADREIVINASWGLGEALVSGQVDPDEFVVRKGSGELMWSRIGEKTAAREGTAAESKAAESKAEGRTTDAASLTPALTPAQILDLTGVLMRIERWFGTPQDVEWCHDGSSFWIVQSRPVTTGVTTGRAPGTRDIEWTRANIAEVLPDLTSPQVLAAFEDLLNQGERRFAGALMAPESELGPMVKAFCGRLHFNLSQLRHVCAMGGIAPAAMLRSIGHAGAIDPADEVSPGPSWAQIRRLPALIGMVRKHARAAAIVRAHRTRTEQYLAELASRDPRRLSDADLLAAFDDWTRRAPAFMEAVLLLSNVMFHELPLRRICEKVGVSFEAFVYPQLATGERSVSAQQAYDLVALAALARSEPRVVQFLKNEPASGLTNGQTGGLAGLTSGDERLTLSGLREALRGTAFVAALEEFLKAYGHRGRYEYDWSLPRYAEDPAPLLLALRAHLDGTSNDAAASRPEHMTNVQEEEAARAWRVFEQALTPWQRRTLLPRVRRSIAQIKRYYVWREQVRSDLVRIIGALRGWHLVLAERFVERGWIDRRDDYFLIRLPEIASASRSPVTSASPSLSPSAALRAIVADRRKEQARYAAIQMPLLMRESELPSLIRTAYISGSGTSSTDDELTGQAVSGGCVEAEVVVVRDPGDFGRMKRGAILVAPATDPSWTPLFTLASGVIVEVGGVLSHASTIAREYGLPAIANVRQATRRLRTGDRVRLDANQGFVRRLSAASAPARRV